MTLLLLSGSILLGVVVYLKLPTLESLSAGTEHNVDPNRLRDHVLFMTVTAFPRNYTHPENLDRVAVYIREQFLTTTSHVTEQAYRIEGIPFRNVVARYGPAAGPLTVIGAHYDAYQELPGADDNASGVAGLLELAGLLGRVDIDHPVELVAYSTEEPPFYGTAHMGSAVHARSLREANIDLKGMICLEMIGYYNERQLYPYPSLKRLYPEEGNFIAVIGRWQDRGLIRHLKKGFNGAEMPVQSVTLAIENSDHLSYWRQGYRAVMVTDTAWARNRNYHTERDTVDTLNYPNMALVVEGVFNAIANVGSLK